MSSEEQRADNRLWEELNLLRTRVHNVVSELNGVQLLLKDNSQRILDTNKRVKENEKILKHLENSVEEMQKADAIAEGIANRLSERRDTKWRIWGVRVAIVSAIVAGVGTLVDITIKVTH